MVNYNDQRKYWSEFVFYERLLVIKKGCTKQPFFWVEDRFRTGDL